MGSRWEMVWKNNFSKIEEKWFGKRFAIQREDQRRERVRRKKMQVREKVEKSRITVLFQ
jgi:hypothetical protein